jgi:hypothetical protein
MSNDEKLKLCRGCYNDHYNQPGNSTLGHCWSLDTAKPVERTSVGTWQEPPYSWQPKTTLSCHRQQGSSWISRDDVRLVENGAKPWRDEPPTDIGYQPVEPPAMFNDPHLRRDILRQTDF